MPDILRLAAIAVTAALCAAVVRKGAAELGLVLAVTAGAVLLSTSLDALSSVRALMDLLSDTAGLSPAVLAPVVKTSGIAILTRLAAELCGDAGESGIAAFVETAGTILALAVSLPLVGGVLKMMEGMLM